jgi:hypothetical protein
MASWFMVSSDLARKYHELVLQAPQPARVGHVQIFSAGSAQPEALLRRVWPAGFGGFLGFPARSIAPGVDDLAARAIADRGCQPVIQSIKVGALSLFVSAARQTDIRPLLRHGVWRSASGVADAMSVEIGQVFGAGRWRGFEVEPGKSRRRKRPVVNLATRVLQALQQPQLLQAVVPLLIDPGAAVCMACGGTRMQAVAAQRALDLCRATPTLRTDQFGGKRQVIATSCKASASAARIAELHQVGAGRWRTASFICSRANSAWHCARASRWSRCCRPFGLLRCRAAVKRRAGLLVLPISRVAFMSAALSAGGASAIAHQLFVASASAVRRWRAAPGCHW